MVYLSTAEEGEMGTSCGAAQGYPGVLPSSPCSLDRHLSNVALLGGRRE